MIEIELFQSFPAVFISIFLQQPGFLGLVVQFRPKEPYSQKDRKVNTVRGSFYFQTWFSHLPSTWCGFSFLISLLLTCTNGFLVFSPKARTSLVVIGFLVLESISSTLSCCKTRGDIMVTLDENIRKGGKQVVETVFRMKGVELL